MWIAIGIIVVLVILVVLSLPKKKDIPKKFEKAQAYLKSGHNIKAMSLMNEILIFPINDKYTYDEAKQAIKSLELLKEICRDLNIDKETLIDSAIQAFQDVPCDGGKVTGDIIDELEKFVSKISSSVSNQADMLIEEAKKGNILNDKKSDKDFTDNVTSTDELEIINSVGKYILKRKIKEGITFIDDHMPAEMTDFKATLLDQKAGLLFMNNNIEEAVNIYDEILISYPDNYRIICSLAEGLDKLNRVNEAVEKATIVAQFSKDKYLQKTANKILKKHKVS